MVVSACRLVLMGSVCVCGLPPWMHVDGLHEENVNGLWKSVVHTHARVVCAMGHADLLLGTNGVSVWMEMDR